MSRYIKASLTLRNQLLKEFKCSRVSICNALNFRTFSPMAKKIRNRALACGGELMEPVFNPDCETRHTNDAIIQTFENGVMLMISKKDSSAELIRKGEVVKKYRNVTLDKWGFLMDQASLMANVR